MKIIETARLILRTWQSEDLDPYYRINQDPKVIEFLLGTMSQEEVKQFIDKNNQQQETRGFTLWAAELKVTHELIGFIGLNYTDWPAHFTPAVEVGWRLGSEYWGNGYATEGAKACLDYGFNQCGLKEIVSFTVPANLRSIRVMERIGMLRDVNDDFSHPRLASEHRLSRHVLYRIKHKNCD
ncbi:MAG TPA: GNAT family N-acetyltransferase [Gammaproteobacteria bacterium]|nr:GNAT family N-acetyltransferase [Gammaproteobacteria bacterium]